MKIIFVTREGVNLPGARIRCYNLAGELIRHGIDANVLSFSDTLGAKDGERECQLRLQDKVRLNWKAFIQLLKENNSIFIIQRFNYHSFAPYLVHLFRGNRIVLDLDDWEMRENPRYYFGFYPSSKAHQLTRKIAQASIFCIAASRFLEKFLSDSNKHTYYIPSGVDTELFNPSLNCPDKEKITFSWIGTFHRKEYIANIQFALYCFSQLRKRYSHIYLDILGDGAYRDVIRKIVSDFRDQNISLKNWISPGDVPGYLAKIDIGLFPVAEDSKFNIAKSPTKLFEYMSMAKPSVSSIIGEAAEIIQDGDSGFLAKNKEEFVEKMGALIENQALRQRLGDKARHKAEDSYSLRVLGKQLAEVFKKY